VNALNRHIVRGVMAMLLSMMCVYLAPEDVYAHAYPDHADPKVGSTVSAGPSLVRIWFDSDLEPVFSAIHVQDQRGNNVDKGDGRVDAADPTLLEASVPLLASGTYRVFWDVVARDGHRTSGNFSFTIK
jgi:methionine-rich copper-binding protein CopC